MLGFEGDRKLRVVRVTLEFASCGIINTSYSLDDRSPVTELLKEARRRCFTHLVLEQSAIALAIGTGGAILLLLTGTEILNWYWVALLMVASLGTGLYRLRATIPSTYKLAQRIDRRLNLADALSTATYFASPDAHGDPAIREKQRQEADAVARTIDASAAVPIRRPKYAYHALALAAIAFGLFAVRYAVTGRLDLQPNLVKMAFDTFFPSKPQVAQRQEESRSAEIAAARPGRPGFADGAERSES